MAEREILARGYTWEINTGTVGTPVWVAIAGIDTWKPSVKKTNADTTTNDDDGVPTHIVADRTTSYTLSGKVELDPDDGSRDAGQEAVEAAGELIGDGSADTQFRRTDPGGNTKTFTASVQVTDGGGKMNDPSAWEVTLDVSGAITAA